MKWTTVEVLSSVGEVHQGNGRAMALMKERVTNAKVDLLKSKARDFLKEIEAV